MLSCMRYAKFKKKYFPASFYTLWKALKEAQKQPCALTKITARHIS